MKKLISLALALLLVFSLAVTGFATEPELDPEAEPETGSITINGVGEGTEYNIYCLMDLESYNTAGKGAYSYKVNPAWAGFFAGPGASYITVDASGYVTWSGSDADADVAAFAKLALAYAKANGIAAVKSSDTEGAFVISGTKGVFSDLPLGWYLVDSSAGALCGLTTTNPDASINAKNGVPTIDKQVKEDSTNQWADSNTADIGQDVEFRTTINVHPGPENFILHDIMSAGLTLKSIGAVQHLIPGTSDTHDMQEGVDYVVYVKTEIEGKDYNVDSTMDCTFEIRFTEALMAKLNTNDKIIVHYTAMLNRNAIIAGDGNSNSATLEYGEGHVTTPDQTITKTYGIDIVKTDSQNTLLNGAEFLIYDAETGGNLVPVVLMDDNVTYRRARPNEPGINIVVENGRVRVVGLDNGTYYLEEQVAPSGYNKLSARQKFIISDSNLDAVFNGDIFSTGSGVHVVNKTGTMLPETGAMGTTLFLMFGSLVVIATGVLLVTKKRMTMIQD